MKLLNKSMVVLSLGLGLAAGSAVPVLAAGHVGFQDYREDRGYGDYFGQLRQLIDRTQADLRAAAELEHGNKKQHERYHDAQGHLSTLDRDLSRGKFGKSELNKSIDSIKSILDNNVLQASSREALQQDLEGLRMVREHHESR
jgi:hypothetical protein